MLLSTTPVQILYGNDEDGWQPLETAVNSEAAHPLMSTFRKENFPRLAGTYWRSWMNGEGEQMVDFGSHVNFFKLKPLYH